MRTVMLSVLPNEDGQTVGKMLTAHLSVSSRLLAELKRNGGIRLNGVSAAVNQKVRTGDEISVCLCEEAPSKHIVPEDIPLSVLYEDEDILAISKPKNMPVHPSLHHYGGTVGNAVCFRYRAEPFVFRPITRLDIDTTGIVLIAKNRLSAGILSDEMKNGKIHKTYYAVLSGTPREKTGRIDAPIERCGDSIIKRTVRPDGKSAQTDYAVIKPFADGTCVACIKPLTGRTHQIRVHMAYIGCPLLFDYMYGTEIPGETLYLHCGELAFVHPISKKNITLRDDWETAFSRFL